MDQSLSRRKFFKLAVGAAALAAGAPVAAAGANRFGVTGSNILGGVGSVTDRITLERTWFMILQGVDSDLLPSIPDAPDGQTLFSDVPFSRVSDPDLADLAKLLE